MSIKCSDENFFRTWSARPAGWKNFNARRDKKSPLSVQFQWLKLVFSPRKEIHTFPNNIIHISMLQHTRYCIRICCCLLVAFIVFISSSRMEDTLETEIDPRLPSSFPISELVHPRLFAFNKLVIHKYGELPSSLSVSNWEVFAYKWVALNFNSLIEPWFQNLNKWRRYGSNLFLLSYWYETRKVNASCPQEPRGIAAACDWVLTVPCLFGNTAILPRIIR